LICHIIAIIVLLEQKAYKKVIKGSEIAKILKKEVSEMKNFF
jgi:hypothetical protein